MNGDGAKVQRMPAAQAPALTGIHQEARRITRRKTSHCKVGIEARSTAAPTTMRATADGEAKSTLPIVLGSIPMDHATAAPHQWR